MYILYCYLSLDLSCVTLFYIHDYFHTYYFITIVFVISIAVAVVFFFLK